MTETAICMTFYLLGITISCVLGFYIGYFMRCKR